MLPSLQPDSVGDSAELRKARLLTAYDQLATVLETIDLEREPRLADEIVEAIEATDRAYSVEAAGDETARAD